MLILLHHRPAATRAALALAMMLGLSGLARLDAPAPLRVGLALVCLRPLLRTRAVRSAADRPAAELLDLGPTGVLLAARSGLRIVARRGSWGRLHGDGSCFALRGGVPGSAVQLPAMRAARRELSALGRHLHHHRDGRPAVWWPSFAPQRRRGGRHVWL